MKRNGKIILKSLQEKIFFFFNCLLFKKNIKKSFCNKKIENCNSGVAALEASLTLPIIVMMIFFILEMMKVNNTRTAIDSIALEATLEFIAQKKTTNFVNIINKYRPGYVKKEQIDYFFTFYKSLDDLCSTAPYGNEEAYWNSTSNYIDTDKSNNYTGPKNYINISDKRKPENYFNSTDTSADKCITGKVFVLTVVCDYHFSSAFVQKFFAGGANTKNGKNFIIWSRGVGICH